MVTSAIISTRRPVHPESWGRRDSISNLPTPHMHSPLLTLRPLHLPPTWGCQAIQLHVLLVGRPCGRAKVASTTRSRPPSTVARASSVARFPFDEYINASVTLCQNETLHQPFQAYAPSSRVTPLPVGGALYPNEPASLHRDSEWRSGMVPYHIKLSISIRLPRTLHFRSRCPGMKPRNRPLELLAL